MRSSSRNVNPNPRLRQNLSSAAMPLKNQKGRTLAAVLGFSGAILAYQTITAPELHAESPVDRLPPALYSQHIQVWYIPAASGLLMLMFPGFRQLETPWSLYLGKQ